MKILIAEDNAALASFLCSAFRSLNYEVVVAENGKMALDCLNREIFDVLILDLDLPLISGTKVLTQVRATNRHLPILVMTGRERVEDRVAHLDAGADDYITKPFSLSELMARVRALARRNTDAASSLLRMADLVLDRVHRKVVRGGRAIELTVREFTLLEYFMSNPGRHITRSMLLQHVWNVSPETITNVVDVYVNYLRKKVDEGAKIKLIHTIRGVGYRFGPVNTSVVQ
jgi:DNA-binding response OmpR family regulator